MELIEIQKSGERIDIFLARHTGLPRAQIQKLIKQGSITVDGKIEPADFRVEEKNSIRIDSFNIKREAPAMSPRKEYGGKIGIVCETEGYLVVDKPAGLPVHGAAHMSGSLLVDFIIKRFPEIIRIGPDPDRPGIVHRIDKDASGLLVIARTEDSFEDLKKQFRGRKIRKKYIALIHDPLAQASGIIDFPIARASSGFKMAARPRSQEGKTAVTEYEVLKNYFHFSLVSVSIKTGRTHQIRAHFAAIGHPLVGDDLYGAKKFRDKNKILSLGRIFLHASELGFNDLSGKAVSFHSDLPENLTVFLKTIK
jgi:23S rRNA pseudouridine1911/1915/1917 synthase